MHENNEANQQNLAIILRPHVMRSERPALSSGIGAGMAGRSVFPDPVENFPDRRI
jgi:hypothetical protein